MSLALKLGRLLIGRFVGGVVRGLLVFGSLALAIFIYSFRPSCPIHALLRKEWTSIASATRSVSYAALCKFAFCSLRSLHCQFQRLIGTNICPATVTAKFAFCTRCKKKPTIDGADCCHPHSIRSLCDRQSKLLIPHNHGCETSNAKIPADG